MYGIQLRIDRQNNKERGGGCRSKKTWELKLCRDSACLYQIQCHHYYFSMLGRTKMNLTCIHKYIHRCVYVFITNIYTSPKKLALMLSRRQCIHAEYLPSRLLLIDCSQHPTHPFTK